MQPEVTWGQATKVWEPESRGDLGCNPDSARVLHSEAEPPAPSEFWVSNGDSHLKRQSFFPDFAVLLITFFLLPLEILARHLVKHDIEGFVKLPQSVDDIRVYLGVSSTLGLAQASGSTAVLWLL